MPTESVKLIISAQDRASAVLSGIGTAVEGVEDKIGGLAKQSAEGGLDVSDFLSQFAGEELTAFGDQLQTMKEKLADFNASNVKGAKGLGLMKAGLIVAAATGGFKFGQWLIDANGLQEEFQDGLAKSRQLVEELNSATSKLAQQQQFELNLIRDPEEKRKQLETLLETAQKNLKGTRVSAELATKQFDDMNTTFNSWTGNQILELMEQNSKDANAAIEGHRQGVEELQKQLNQFNQAEAARIAADREAAEKTRKDSIHEIVKALREQATTIGMTNEQLEIYKLKQLGANDIALRAAKDYHAQAIAAKEASEAIKESAKAAAERQAVADQQAASDKSAIDALQAQLIAMQQGTEAAAQFRDAQSGMSAEAQAQAAALRDQIAAAKERNDLEKDAKKIIEDNKSAQQKFFEEYKKQAKADGAGLIDPDTFAKSTKKLRDQLANELKQGAGQSNGPITANEDRFSIRGGGSDAGSKQLEAAKSANAILAKIDAKMQENNTRLEESNAKLAEVANKKEEVVG